MHSSKMFSPRRGIIAVVTIICIFFLSSTLWSRNDHTPGLVPEQDDVSTRAYPPPSLPRNAPKQQIPFRDMASRPLRERLHYYFPYDMESKFPAYIWQTWKANPASSGFDSRLRIKEASWTEKHPGFVHEVIVDEAADHLIRYLFSPVPEVYQAYEAMPLPVLKADFFRYLILLARGGIYSDIDTQALQPAENWIPQSYDQTKLGLVVGIEADPDREDWKDWYARRIQFCQWTIQAKPGHPVLVDLVATITDDALTLQKRGELVKGREPTSKSVMEFTGPGVWTDAIFNYFNDRRYFDFSRRQGNVSVNEFFNLQEHRKIGDVVVLPITSFSPGVGQMGAAGPDDPLAYVLHDFEGSWKPENEKKKIG